MKNSIFVGAATAWLLLSAGAALADTPVKNGTVPASIGDVFGTLGGSTSSGGGGGGGGPSSPYLDGGSGLTSGAGGAGLNPVGGSGTTSSQTNNPAVAPLPPAVLSGLAGLAAVGLIGCLRRRSIRA